ncbi:MAG: dephospho-CoA kinase [Thiogranum sp.]|nr:dephospho-CoA kinase [Thiogranum sp.]
MACGLRIGLTGGIGSGKSEASRYFAEIGVPVIDTDVIARELVEPDQPALAEIATRFGDDVLDATGHLDRARLRQQVFADAEKRRQLESILHPRIRVRAEALANQIDAPYCVMVIPLLVETARDYPIDRILVIDTPVELQYQRLALRDGLSDREIKAVIEIQADRQQRLDAADDVVLNDGSVEQLHARIDELHRFYLKLAKSQS